MLLYEVQRVECGVRLGLPRRECCGLALRRFIHLLPYQVLFSFRFHPSEQVRFILSCPRDEIHQESVKSVAVQFIYPAKGLPH
jgi:hypothetical protein